MSDKIEEIIVAIGLSLLLEYREDNGLYGAISYAQCAETSELTYQDEEDIF